MAEGPAAFLSEHPVRKLRFDGRVVRVLRVRGLTTRAAVLHERPPSTKLIKRYVCRFEEEHVEKLANSLR